MEIYALFFQVPVYKFCAMQEGSISSLQLITVRWWNATAYYAVILSKILSDNGHPTLVGGSFDSPPIENAKELNLQTYSQIHLESLHPVQFYRNLKQLKRLISQHHIQLINAHRPEDHLFGGLLRKRPPHLPLVRTVGDVRPPKNNPVNKWLHLQATDFFIFSCEANKRRYQEVWPIPDEKTAVIYAAVDTEHFKPEKAASALRTELNIPENATVFGMVGRFSPVKGHRTFLSAAAQVIREAPQTVFIISGEEVEISKAELSRFAGDLGILNSVRFLDKIDDVRRVISALDVGVICSEGSEAVSRIAGETMSMAKPIIVSEVNVLPEMIRDEQEGFIVRPGSDDELAAKMEIFVQNKELFKTMGQNARKNAEKNFSYQTFLSSTLAVYQNVLEQTR